MSDDEFAAICIPHAPLTSWAHAHWYIADGEMHGSPISHRRHLNEIAICWPIIARVAVARIVHGAAESYVPTRGLLLRYEYEGDAGLFAVQNWRSQSPD